MLEMTITGLDEIVASLSRISRSRVMQETLRAVGGEAEQVAKESIERSVDADTGGAYKRLRSTTLRRHRTGVPLIESGELLSEAGGYTADAQRVSISAGMAYGVYHQFGTERTPQRKFVPLREAWYAQKFTSALARRMETL